MINILGAGAVGCLWAIHCVLAGAPYRLYSRQHSYQRSMELVRDNNITRVTINVHHYDEWQSAEINLICVKAFALDSLVQQMGDRLWHSSVPVLMMNGMGLEQAFMRAGYQGPLVQASFAQGARIEGDQLRHTGHATTTIGLLQPATTVDNTSLILQGSELSAKLRSGLELANLLDAVLPEVKWSDNQIALLWQKLLVNAIINPLTALSGQANSSLIENDQLCAPALALLKEAWPVVEVQKLGLNYSDVQRNILTIARNTSANHSSMLQDVMAGRPTEIGQITGFLLEQAHRSGILLPQHQNLYDQIRLITKGA